MSNDLKGHFWLGPDDAILQKLETERSGSAWLASAIGVFAKVIGPELLGEAIEGAPAKQARTYNVELPRWAASYVDRLPYGYQTRFVRAAAWFYLGRLSNRIDIDALFAKLQALAQDGQKPARSLSDLEKKDIEEFVNQF